MTSLQRRLLRRTTALQPIAHANSCVTRNMLQPQRRCHTVSARSLVSLARHLKQESIRLDDNVCLDIGCPANHVVAAFAVEAA